MTTIESFPDIQHSLLAHRRGSWARRIPALAAVVLVAGACSTGGTSSASAPTSTAAASASAEAPSASVEPSLAAWEPTGPITFVVPFAAGGPTDTVTRLVAEPMSATLGQQVVVSNVAGAGGTLAAGQVAEAAADGYTVLMHHIGMSTAPSLYTDLPYDPLTSFKTIGLVTEVPMTIVGGTEFAPNTLQELVDHLKANTDLGELRQRRYRGGVPPVRTADRAGRRGRRHRSRVRRHRARRWMICSATRSTSCATRRPTPRPRSRPGTIKALRDHEPRTHRRACPMSPRRPRPGCRTSRSACGTGSTSRPTHRTTSSRRSRRPCKPP